MFSAINENTGFSAIARNELEAVNGGGLTPGQITLLVLAGPIIVPALAVSAAAKSGMSRK